MTIQDYFRHFDNTFDTNISDNIIIGKFPMLNIVFNNMGEHFFNESFDKKKINKSLLQIENKLIDTLNNSQRDLFEQYAEIENISATELAKQMLIFGYAVAYQELKEMDALK